MVNRRLGSIENIRLIEPQPYAEFVALLASCRLTLTDSGGVQEEAPSLGKPVLVMRNTTERPEGLVAGTAKLVGADAVAIVAETTRLLSDDDAYRQMSEAINPYGDGHAAQRIVAAIEHFFAPSQIAAGLEVRINPDSVTISRSTDEALNRLHVAEGARPPERRGVPDDADDPQALQESPVARPSGPRCRWPPY